MGDIEWTDATWNPITGCTKISPGCKNCYAERMARRLQTIPNSGYERGFELTFHPDRLEQPLHWKKPRMVFVCSMGDLFHKDLQDQEIDRVLATMLLAPRHTFQILTKRSDRLESYFGSPSLYRRVLDAVSYYRMQVGSLCHIPISDPSLFPAKWIWIGVSVEDRKHGLPRIDHLRNTPAALRFLSIEPLLEELGPLDLRGIDWVIVGGESGPRARPCALEWIRSIIRQCKSAKVPCFVKQLGSYATTGNGKGNDPAKWPEDLRVRQMPEVLQS